MTDKGVTHLVYTTEHPMFDNRQNRRLAFWQQQNTVFQPENRIEFHFLDEEGLNLEKDVVNKFLLTFVDKGVVAEIEREFNQNGELSLAFSDVGLVDVNAAGVNKGKGAKVLSELFGFSLENTLALGDNYNDLEMLEVCGMPVVPQNGEESVKERARYVTAHNDDSPLTHAVRHLYPGLLD